MTSKLQTSARSGPARVRLKSGATYVGHVIYDGRAVTVRGRLEVTELWQGAEVTRRLPPVCKTIPFALVREIAWT